jgi:EAL and modified HD-GYP domain-containing signal transduction protein
LPSGTIFLNDETEIGTSMTKITSLIPIVNNQQKLFALIPSSHHLNDVENIHLIQTLNKQLFFEKNTSLMYFLPIENPFNIPIDLAERVPSKAIILCIVESQCESKEAQLRLKHFVDQGFSVCMDEFSSKSSVVWSDTRGISLDCSHGTPSHAKEWLFKLHSNQHLAKNIQTSQLLQDALDAGFTLFYGEFPFSIEARNRSEDSTSRTRLLKLLGLVSRDADSVELEALFKQDTSLSFMLFKIVSTAAFSQSVTVSSFKQAINLLGRRQLQRWLQLLLYARGQGQGTALNPLMLRAAFRASMMEEVSKQEGGDADAQDCAFMAGMFSLLDILFGSPLEEILKPLTLTDEVMNALLHRHGKLGQQLNLVCLADRENFDDLNAVLNTLGMETVHYYQAIIQAYAWVNQLSQDM